MQQICNFIAKWMGVIVLIVAILSLIVPASLTWIGTWVINPMLGIIMFGMGLTLTEKDFKFVVPGVFVYAQLKFSFPAPISKWHFAMPRSRVV